MCRILVVDEQAVFRELVAEVLSQRGHEAVCAVTEDDALAYLRGNRVDVVLVDVPTPGADARGLIGSLRADERLRRIPVLVLDEGEDAGGAWRDGPDVSPVTHVDRSHFRLEELLMRVEECLGRARGPGEERRESGRVSIGAEALAVYVDGAGPWQVVDVSAKGLGIIAGARLEEGQSLGILLVHDTIPYGGRMRVCHRVGLGGGRFRYGLQIVERASVLGRALASLRMRLTPDSRRSA